MSSTLFSLVSGLGFDQLRCKRTDLPTARSISISRRLLVSLASFPFFTLDSWLLARFSFWMVYECTRYNDSTRLFFYFCFWGSTTYDDSGSPLTSPTLSLDIPNSITNVQIKRDSVDRCSPLPRGWISLHNTHTPTYTYTFSVYKETV
jgi:hypothetical protein